MRFSIAGIMISILTIWIVISKRGVEKKLIALFTLNLIYEGFVNIGYWGIVGNLTLKVSDFLQLIMVLYAALILLKKGMPIRTLIFTLCILASVFLLVTVPFDEPVRAFDALDKNERLYDVLHYVSLDTQCIKTTLRLICFAWNASAIYQCITVDDWLDIRNKYFKAGRYIIAYAWIEFVIKNIFHSGDFLQSFLQIFFQAANSSNLYRNGLYSVVGLTGEPSQFAMIMFSYWLVYIIGKEWCNQTQYMRWFTMSSFILMFLSGSFRVVGMLPILLVMYMVVSEKSAKNIMIAGGISLIVIILSVSGMFDYYLGRLGNAVAFLKSLDASVMTGGEAGRLNTVVEAFRVWLKKPLFGIGPGETFAYGFIPSMLATTGLIGTISWYKLMFGTIGGISISNKYSRKALLLVLVFSVSWIYTDSIAIGYSIYVFAMALEFRRTLYWTEQDCVPLYDEYEGN